MSESRASESGGGSDRGVSPMIGVGMMVAIAVLLATVVGVFTITVGTAPDAELVISEAGEDDESGTVTLHHEGGETIDLNDFSVIVDGSATGASLDGELAPGESRSVPTGITDFDGDGPAAYEIELRHDSSSSTMLTETVAVEV